MIKRRMRLLAAIFVLAVPAPCGALAAEEAIDLETLIKELGSDSADSRDAAEAKLGELGVRALSALFDATQSDDPERVRRARRLITRLEGAAFAELHREAASADKARAEQARLLLEGLTDRLIQRSLQDLLSRIETAAKQGRVTDAERQSWTRRLTSGQTPLTVDERGRLSETGLERQLSCREALPPEAVSGGAEVETADLRAFRSGGELPEVKYVPAWDAFTAEVGEAAGQRALFADMLLAEPALMAAAAEVFAAADQDAPEAAARGRLLGGLFDLRAQDFSASFRASTKSLKPGPGKLYPDVYDDPTLGRLTCFLFIRSEMSEHLPTPTFSGISQVFTTGMAGYFPTRQPLFEMLEKPTDEKPKAIRTLFESAALTAKTGSDLQTSLTVAMFYRLGGVAVELARRILDDQPETYASDHQRGSITVLAGHALRSHGRSPQDIALAVQMLGNDEQVRLGGYRKEDNRKYIEIREMGMMALLKMLGRRPEDIGGTSKVTGYCPVKRYVKFDAIRDTERWDDIVEKLKAWAAEKSD